MEYSGNILKMKSALNDEGDTSRVSYILPLGENDLRMDSIIDTRIRIEYKNRINCIHCNRLTNKSFAQGYCYPCFASLPQTDACILHPEKCEAHLGISRDISWSKENCLQDHIVYLALTPGLKVGVTRFSQIPTRWIDQGAWEAIKIARTPNRHIAGSIEVFLKNYLADKTNWRHMLSGKRSYGIDLQKEKERVSGLLNSEFKDFLSDDNEICRLSYPVSSFPEKVKSLNMDTTPLVEGVLSGIKGQYLIFQNGEVLNIRKHGGYYITLSN